MRGVVLWSFENKSKTIDANFLNLAEFIVLVLVIVKEDNNDPGPSDA